MKSASTLVRRSVCSMLIQTFALCGILALTTACSSISNRVAVPENLSDSVTIEGIEDKVRFWGDSTPPNIKKELANRRSQMMNRLGHPEQFDFNVLALSGGGPNGAFGAGLISGWTEHGSRPQFEIVTGVSTGALIAPFAFLGSGYDSDLKKAFTTLSTRNIIETGLIEILSAIFGDTAISSTAPLDETLRTYITEEMFSNIALEHNRGRRLFIGTTNLDAQRLIIWNIGKLANSDNPDAISLFRKILKASAAIPGAMPPVLFDTNHNGKHYQEMHVDGGVTAQVFLYPMEVEFNVLQPIHYNETRNLYVIRNSKIAPEYQATGDDIVDITYRSISVLIKNQGIGNLYMLAEQAERDGFNYQIAHIPEAFDAESTEEFDPEYMTKLYELGYNMARKGYPWKNKVTALHD